MPDIEIRFHKDMLVLSAPIEYALERQGIDVRSDAEFVSLMEPETVHDALKMHMTAGAQCLVTNTEGICEARLAHKRMEGRTAELAAAALESAQDCKPQHLVCEVGTCGLPLDADSETSRAQNIEQYEDAVRAFGDHGFDAVLMNGLRSAADVECAVAGARAATDRPVFASVDLQQDGTFAGGSFEDVAAALDKADVAGIACAGDEQTLSDAVRRLAALTDKPILVQIELKAATPAEKKRASLGAPVPENPYALPDALADAALAVRAAGAQFVRACGQATPACTGALAVAVAGADCLR
ncbi:phosphoadenosine phosphosulfate sulfotransferase [Slackia faecicanis]|uniref:Phosphoadenosine phosphosulfate sulfotransferase n=1 Tax=Slackia faecicanis TaxID=255723 RepID=A0A3N0AFW5_9ACTN|nr:homocysteine S-methyltransferase family protein [Slackia faecicanis]RNL20634.1 phosphoadenosine phosphosulfate sulfotransferase [Slackia faecicanis]